MSDGDPFHWHVQVWWISITRLLASSTFTVLNVLLCVPLCSRVLGRSVPDRANEWLLYIIAFVLCLCVT